MFSRILTGLKCEVETEPFSPWLLQAPSNKATDPFYVISGCIINTGGVPSLTGSYTSDRNIQADTWLPLLGCYPS